MKKLMFAVAAVAMSMVASASSWTWSTGTSILQDTKGNVMKKADVYLMQTVNATGNKDFTDIIAILGDLQSGAKSISDVTGSAIKVGQTDNDGKILSTSAISFDLETGANAYFYEMAVDGNNVYFSSIVATQPSTNPLLPKGFTTTSGASTQIRDTTGKGAWAGAGWYTVGAVPEPTSGLLLILGVAGLALRRRRA